MSYALMIYLFYQSGLLVELANTRNAGEYSLERCNELALLETRTLPLQPGNDARWQYATCVQVRP